MPLSIYQMLLREGFLQTAFHPRNNSIFNLYEHGELQCISPQGNEDWRLSLPCKPIVFRINSEGNLLAVLGEGELIYCDLLTREIKKVNVNNGYQLLEFSKNSPVLSGFQKSITFMKPNGRTLKTVSFDYLVRQFKVLPMTDSLLIYNENQNLVCTDMDGNVRWLLERLIVHNEIVVSEKGQMGYFVMDPNVLIQFDVLRQSFFEVSNVRLLKCFSMSLDGKALLVLDLENTLIMRDEYANKIWDYNFEHTIEQIQISPKGKFFLTIDGDKILTYYSTNSQEKERGEFFEFKEDKRTFDKESAWTASPGSHHPITHLNLLSVGASGHGLGLIGKDGDIHFYDEQGTQRFTTPFSARVDIIGISDSFHQGYVYGGREILIVDFRNNRTKYILFENSFLGKPLINYYHQNIFLLSKEKELLIYDFEGHLNKAISLNRDYQRGLACESYGIILFKDQKLTGFSHEGKILFKCPLKDRISDIYYTGHTLIWSTKNHRLFTFDLSNLKGKKGELKDKNGDMRIVSTNPLLIVAGKKKLHHLDKDLSTISIHQIESPNSHFFIEGNNFYEIIRELEGFYCYDEKRKMVWRFTSEDRIGESDLMGSGLAFITEDSLQYIAVKNKEGSKKHFSQFLEF
jgi:hypothetical protein